jgi:MFS family permease
MSSGSPLRRHDFRLLLLGQTTSQFGAMVSGVAIPLLAVLTLHASPLQLGIVNASTTVAFALIGLPAGAWVDRWRRRRILIAADLVRAGLLASIPAAWLLGWLGIPQLIVVALLAGVARVFFDVGYQSYLPTVIGPDHVLAGNSALETVRASGQVLGPGLGGWLVALLGAADVVLIQAATFLVSAACLIGIRTRERVLERHPDRPRLRAQIAEGWHVVRGTPALRATAATSAAGNFAFAIASSVTVLFMVQTLRLTSTAIGFVLALSGLSVVIGAALTPWLARRIGSARIIWLPLAVTGPLTMLGVLARPGWLLGLLGLSTVAGELGQITYAITSVSLRQRLCPPNLLGRVNATMRFLIMGLFPVGALLGGVLAEVIGLRGTLAVAFGIVAVSPLPTYRAVRHARDVEDIETV